MKPVGSGGQIERACCDANGIVGFDGLGSSGDGIRSAGDLQIVLAHHAVVGGADGQHAQSIQYQIIPGENHTVRIGVPVRYERTGDTQGIDRVGGGDKDLVRLSHINAGEVVVDDAHAVQNQMHLGVAFLVRFHVDGDVCRRTGQDIHAFLGDMKVLPVGHGQIHRVGQVRGLIQIPAAEQGAGVDHAGACDVCRGRDLGG